MAGHAEALAEKGGASPDGRIDSKSGSCLSSARVNAFLRADVVAHFISGQQMWAASRRRRLSRSMGPPSSPRPFFVDIRQLTLEWPPRRRRRRGIKIAYRIATAFAGEPTPPMRFRGLTTSMKS